MANCVCSTQITSFNSPSKPSLFGNSVAGKVIRVNDSSRNTKSPHFHSLEVKATKDDGKTVKAKSIVCTDCDGNGALVCSQCKGDGVNSVDHFNGQFKAGGLCWLCRGKREILCGGCNGAGFVGGFMSTFDS